MAVVAFPSGGITGNTGVIAMLAAGRSIINDAHVSRELFPARFFADKQNACSRFSKG
jgi:hypothetical protein